MFQQLFATRSQRQCLRTQLLKATCSNGKFCSFFVCFVCFCCCCFFGYGSFDREADTREVVLVFVLSRSEEGIASFTFQEGNLFSKVYFPESSDIDVQLSWPGVLSII